MPVIEALLLVHLQGLLPGSALGQALHHPSSQWRRLARCVEDGSYPIDHKPCENSIYPFVADRTGDLCSVSLEAARLVCDVRFASLGWASLAARRALRTLEQPAGHSFDLDAAGCLMGSNPFSDARPKHPAKCIVRALFKRQILRLKQLTMPAQGSLQHWKAILGG